MPSATDIYGFPYPLKNDQADGPAGFQNLAQRIEDVLAAQFGRVITADTPEIGFTGDSTGPNPLKANLKGARNGDWDVTGTVRGNLVNGAGGVNSDASLSAPAGDLVLGKQGAGVAAASRLVRLIQTISGVNWETRLFNSSGGDTVLATLKAGAVTHYFYVTDTGQLLSQFGGQTRPVPFATWVGNVSVSHVADIIVTSSVNMTAGRFTVTPNVTACVYASSSFCLGVLSTTDKNGVDLQTRYHLNTATNNSFGLRVHAIQMTPTAATGLEAPIPRDIDGVPVIENVATCRVSGCENEGVNVVRSRPADAVIWCGPCGQRITDVTTA